jgi:hypothetical protein
MRRDRIVSPVPPAAGAAIQSQHENLDSTSGSKPGPASNALYQPNEKKRRAGRRGVALVLLLAGASGAPRTQAWAAGAAAGAGAGAASPEGRRLGTQDQGLTQRARPSDPEPARDTRTPGSAGASACPVSDQKPCAIVLHGPKAPSVSPNCTTEPWSKFVTFTLPDRISDSNRDAWWETVMKVDIDATKGCSCAIFRVFYDSPVLSYSVNIGDSPTNNGTGGDAGTTFKEAEMQIVDDRLEVYTASRGGGARNVERIFAMDLTPLEARSLDLKVCDESLEFWMPEGPGGVRPTSWKLQTPASGLLYDLTPSATYEGQSATKRRADGIFAAFNRIIHVKEGAPSPPQRVGTGVRQVEIRLAP